jgi:hypothetical protein
VLACLIAAPATAQAPPSRSDSLLLEIANALLRGRADANAAWFEEWFGGEFLLIRPEGGVLAVLDDSRPDSVKSLLRRYLSVRSDRTLLLPPEARSYESSEDRNEASAQLVAYRSALTAVEGSGDRLPELVRSDLANTPPFDDPRATHALGYFRQWHVYATGAAIGILLERLGVDWRAEMQRGATFVDLLTRAVADP